LTYGAESLSVVTKWSEWSDRRRRETERTQRRSRARDVEGGEAGADHLCSG
jgi:hypothetical protein